VPSIIAEAPPAAAAWTSSTPGADAPRPAPVLSTAPRGRALPVWTRYAAGSIVATVLSQIALLIAYGLLGTSAALASLLAFVAGTIPNYLLNKAWVWHGRRLPRRLVAAYVLVVAVTNVVAIALTLAADACVRAHVQSDGPRTALLDAAYLSSYGLMFVVKCLLFDGPLFKPALGR
jgi:putative flippase GtrA